MFNYDPRSIALLSIFGAVCSELGTANSIPVETEDGRRKRLEALDEREREEMDRREALRIERARARAEEAERKRLEADALEIGAQLLAAPCPGEAERPKPKDGKHQLELRVTNGVRHEYCTQCHEYRLAPPRPESRQERRAKERKAIDRAFKVADERAKRDRLEKLERAMARGEMETARLLQAEREELVKGKEYLERPCTGRPRDLTPAPENGKHAIIRLRSDLGTLIEECTLCGRARFATK